MFAITKRKKLAFSIAVLAGLLLSLAVLDFFNYFNPQDPRSVQYHAWKAGWNNRSDINDLVLAMSLDARRDELVVGKSTPELRKKFGYVLTLDEALPYYKTYCVPHEDSKQYLMIRDSPFAVKLRDGRGTKIVLFKGC